MQRSKHAGAFRWGRKGKRGVSPIIATILLVAITVVLAAVLYILISGLTKGPGATPIGTALALGGITDSTQGAVFVYTATVQTAGGGMTWSNMIFQVHSSNGAILSVGPANVSATSPSGTPASCTASLYTFSTTSWAAYAGSGKCTAGTLGGSTLVSSGAQITVYSTVTLAGQGDSLIAIGQGSYSGTESFAIP